MWICPNFFNKARWRPDLDPRDRAYDCKEGGAIVKRSKPGWERRSLSTWSTHFYFCLAVEAVAGSFTVEAGGREALLLE